MPESRAEEIESQIEQMHEKGDQLADQGLFRSSTRLYSEAAQLAKSNGLVMPYIYSRFFEMDKSQSMLDFERTRECAVELIALIEDEDRVRSIQPDYPQDFFEYTQQWMTACLYENLADVTGSLAGYNSDGMHQCIGDGINVCHRTGKLKCILCFREYAADVYIAADDLLMARHQCETIKLREGDWSNRGDRRWYASLRLGGIHLLEGRLPAAIQELENALRLTAEEEVNSRSEPQLRIQACLDTALILSGETRVDWQASLPETIKQFPPSPGEWPSMERELALNDALAASCAGQHEEAVRMLTEIDRSTKHLNAGPYWFEVRLRMVAALRLGGATDKAERVAAQLKKAAAEVNDFLTLRRLDRLMDPSETADPYGCVQRPDAGPFGKPRSDSEDDGTAADSSAEESDPRTAPTPKPESAEGPGETVKQMMGLMQTFFEKLTEDEDPNECVDELLQTDPTTLTAFDDIGAVLHVATVFAVNSDRAADIWAWGQRVQQAHADDPSVMSLVAVLGENLITDPESPMNEVITADDLLKTHQLALSMDQNRVGNYLRAGGFHQWQGNTGEAERCLARAFRLDRTCVPAAMQLATIYQETDRVRDSLEVLDLCLRSGAEDPNLAMEATALSVNIGQYQATLTYAEKVREFAEEDPTWVDYYRAVALLELGRAEEALEAVTAERRHEHASSLHLECLEASALFTNGDSAAGLAKLQEILQISLFDADELTFNALCRLAGMTWMRMYQAEVPEDHPVRQAFETRLLRSGLMPDGYFDALNGIAPGEEVDDTADRQDVFCYQCLVRQPLDSDWEEAPERLSGQEDWQEYIAFWTVLAADEEAAGKLAVDLQNRCGDATPELLQVEEDSGPYQDIPRVVVQGMRFSPNDEDDDEDLSETE